MKKQTLYQKDRKGNTRVWSIWVEEDFIPKICSESGILGGSLISVETEVFEGTNVGRSNERSPYEQACFDAQSEINKKITAGYVRELSLVKEKHETETINAPMKCETYRPVDIPNKKSYTLAKTGLKNRTSGIQKKLDGWRWRMVIDEFDIMNYASSGKLSLGFPQIEVVARKVYNNLGLTGEVTLDGEIYNHELGFQQVDTACKYGRNKWEQSQLSTKQKELRDKMEFHLFDCVMKGDYPERHEFFRQFISGPIVPVTTVVMLETTDDEIEKLFRQVLSEGYEGLIIRDLAASYEHKRSKRMFKYKPLLDCEARVLGFKRSIAGEMVGSFECELSNGKRFEANPIGIIGTDEMRIKVWKEQQNYIGKYCTILFLNFTDAGLPRHPQAKCFRLGQGID